MGQIARFKIGSRSNSSIFRLNPQCSDEKEFNSPICFDRAESLNEEVKNDDKSTDMVQDEGTSIITETSSSIIRKLPMIKEIAAINNVNVNEDGTVQYNVISLSKKAPILANNKNVPNIIRRVRLKDRINYLTKGDLVRYVIDRRVVDLDREEIQGKEYVRKKKRIDITNKLTDDIEGSPIVLRSQKNKRLFKIVETESRIIE